MMISNARHLPSLATIEKRVESSDSGNAAQKAELQRIFADELAEQYRHAWEAGLENARLAVMDELALEKEKLRIEFEDLKNELKNEARIQEESYRQELATHINELSCVHQAMEANQFQLVLAAEESVVNLAFSCLTKILVSKIQERTLLGDLVKGALRELEEESVWRVSVCEHTAKELMTHAYWKDRIVIDPQKKIGECVIFNTNQKLDAALFSQLEILKVALLSAYGEKV